jgi:hypothetical protein
VGVASERTTIVNKRTPGHRARVRLLLAIAGTLLLVFVVAGCGGAGGYPFDLAATKKCLAKNGATFETGTPALGKATVGSFYVPSIPRNANNGVDVDFMRNPGEGARLWRESRDFLGSTYPNLRYLVHHDGNVVWMWDYAPTYTAASVFAACLWRRSGN